MHSTATKIDAWFELQMIYVSSFRPNSYFEATRFLPSRGSVAVQMEKMAKYGELGEMVKVKISPSLDN